MSETKAEFPVRPSIAPRTKPPMTLSVVTPCYNEEEVFPELKSRLNSVLSKLEIPYEIIFVDDGSKDRTWELLLKAQAEDPHIKAVRLSRNFGHQLAITCGLDQAKGEVVLILDADLQDPPELLPEMLRKWQEGYDVIYGKRRTRQGESVLKRLFAFAFYRTFAKVTGFEMPRDTGDFRLMDRRALKALQALREKHRFVRGMVSWIGYHQCPIYYDRPERFAGITKYPFRKSFFLAIDAITAFSYAPLRMASYLGIGVSCLAFVYIFVVIALKIMGISYRGYTSIIASVLLLGGVQLTVLGMIGEYVGRIFEQGQNRPLYLVDEIRGEPLSGDSN